MPQDELSFEWDERKNRANQKKHGVSFEEAQTAFYDDEGLLRDDPDHSDDEERFGCGSMATMGTRIIPDS